MFMFIIYATLILIISNGYGNFFIKKDSKIYELKSVLGFGIFIGLLQIFYYPFLYLRLSSNFSNLLTCIIALYGLFLGIKTFCKEDYKFIKDYHFYLIIILLFFIMKIVPSVDATDDNFYFPFIIDNSKGLINSISPETGLLKIDIDTYHDFQGYYLFISFIYKIQHFLFNSINDIFVVFRSTFTLLFAIYFSNILSYIKNISFKSFNKYGYYILELLSVVLIGVSHLNHIYFGSFALFTIFVPLLMIVYNAYFNKKENCFLGIIMLEFGLLSLASSSLFLIIMLLSGYFSYEIIIKKKSNIMAYVYLLIPVLVYICFFIKMPYLIILIPIVILFLNKIKKSLNILLEKYGKYLIYSIPVIFILISILLKKVINISLFSKSILLFNFFVLALILYFVIIKKKKINIFIWMFVFTLIFYYNPLTATCVSRFFTTELVFYRISFITKNPLVITSLFVFLYECSKDKFFKLFILLLVVLLAGLYSFNLYKLMMKNADYSYKYNYALRECNENLELGEFVSTLSGKIISVEFQPRDYNTSLESYVYRFMNVEFTDNLNKVIIDNYDIDDLFLTDIVEYDYIISKVKDNSKLSDIYEIVFSNNIYNVYKINKD